MDGSVLSIHILGPEDKALTSLQEFLLMVFDKYHHIQMAYILSSILST